MPRARHLIPLLMGLLCLARAGLAGEPGSTERGVARGRHEQALDLLKKKDYGRAIGIYEKLVAARPDDQVAFYNMACAYALKGQKREALEWLQKSIEVGFANIAHMARDPDLEGLHEEEAYQSILQRFSVVLEEGRSPDLAQIEQMLDREELHKFLPVHLPRYYAPELVPFTLKLLASERKPVRRAAVISLVHQGGGDQAVRARVVRLLGDPDPDLREVAGEYLLWHGTEAEVPALGGLAGKEKDPHALASIRAALAAIARRAERAGKAKRTLQPDKAPPAPATYEEARLLLRVRPTGALRRKAIRIYRERESFEPLWRYAGKDAGEKFIRRRTARMGLGAELFAVPGGPRMKDAPRPRAMEPARSLMPPVRDYFDGERASYGHYVADKSVTFGNSVHVGDDVAWMQDQRTVVAIGNGVVRRVGCVSSWGNLVIIEHVSDDGSWFCSLYAHLASFVCVAPGDIVEKGRKIGSVGRTHTWENGGYNAHLHFGIHRGPYLDAEGRPDWICGYVGKPYFDSGAHGWVDPQSFIRERREKNPKKTTDKAAEPPQLESEPGSTTRISPAALRSYSK